MAINVKDKLVTLESLGVAYSTEQDAREEADQALSTRIDNIVAPEGDPSLTEVSDARVSGSTTYPTLKARLDADKAAIGTDIDGLKADLGALSQGVMSDAAKDALIDCIEHIALWTDGQRDTYVEALRDALYPRTDLVSISAAYDSSNAVYTVDDISVVKSGLTVTATYSDSTTEVLEDGAYTLSGTLSEGTSTVTVYYNGKTATVDVTVTGMRTAALTDVSTSKGITGLTCTNGTFARTSAVVFSAAIFSSSIKRAKFVPSLNTGNNAQWIIFKQEDSGNTCYGYNGSGVTKFEWDGSKYAASNVTRQFTIITVGDGINDLSDKTVSIIGGNVVMTGASGSVTINDANCIGFWISSTSYYLPSNATVNKTE